jgi:hypothetical protein
MHKVNAALDFCKSVQVVEIQNNSQAEAAGKLFCELNSYIKELEELRKEAKEPHIRAGKAVDDFFKSAQLPLSSLRGKLDLGMRTFQKKLADLRRAEQERLNREAEEKRRKEEEAARKEREKAEAYREHGRTDLAEKAEQRADAREQRAETTVAAVAQVAIPKVEGISVRANWKAEITNADEFVEWAAESGKYHFLQPNIQSLNAYAKSRKQPQVIPGARIFNDEKLMGRSI